MSKLDDTLQKWQATRESLLETRRQLADIRSELARLQDQVSMFEAAEARQQKALMEYADKLSSLLHSDVSGVCGGTAGRQAEKALEQESALHKVGSGPGRGLKFGDPEELPETAPQESPVMDEEEIFF